jgi:hypothetical protein
MDRLQDKILAALLEKGFAINADRWNKKTCALEFGYIWEPSRYAENIARDLAALFGGYRSGFETEPAANTAGSDNRGRLVLYLSLKMLKRDFPRRLKNNPKILTGKTRVALKDRSLITWGRA